MSNLVMETSITIRFALKKEEPLTPVEQASLDALNQHAADVARRLQAPMRVLATEMLDLKRDIYAKETSNAGLEQP